MKELVRTISQAEALDIQIMLASFDIDSMLPDQNSLSIAGITTIGQGQGRIWVKEEDFERATAALKNWSSPYAAADTSGSYVNRVLGHPAFMGISPAAIADGIKNWSQLRSLQKIKVLGGLVISTVAVSIFSFGLFYIYVTY